MLTDAMMLQYPNVLERRSIPCFVTPFPYFAIDFRVCLYPILLSSVVSLSLSRARCSASDGAKREIMTERQRNFESCDHASFRSLRSIQARGRSAERGTTRLARFLFRFLPPALRSTFPPKRARIRFPGSFRRSPSTPRPQLLVVRTTLHSEGRARTPLRAN